MKENKLEMHFGNLGVFMPFIAFISGILFLASTNRGHIKAFWAVIMLVIFISFLLSKDKQVCSDAIVTGISRKMVSVIILAFMLAGMIAALLKQAHLVDSLIWLSLSLNVKSYLMPLITFLIAAVMSMATGTALGTSMALGPILFPLGVSFGADGALLAGALLSGAYFGDNLAPVSDTTIASSYTQDAELSVVVKSRIKYAVTAALISSVLFIVIGKATTGNIESILTQDITQFSPNALIMLTVPVVLIIMMLRKYDLIFSMLSTFVYGCIIALLVGLIEPSQILYANMNELVAKGIIIDGIQSMITTTILVILIMAMVGIFEKTSLLDMLLRKADKFTKTPKQTELTCFIVAILTNFVTLGGGGTIILFGPIMKTFMDKHNIDSARSANILDGVAVGGSMVVPYGVGLMLTYSMLGSTGVHIDFAVTDIIKYAFHGWALMGVFLISILTGWGRKFKDGNVEYLDGKSQLSFK